VIAAALLLASLSAAPELGAEPRLVRAPPPELPAGTVFPAPEVTVVLAIDVSATGAVEAVRLEEGAGEPFDSAAIAAAGRYAFEPARLTTGQAVPVTIHFRLRIEAPKPRAAAPAPVRLAGRLLERGTRRPLAGVEVVARAEGERALATATSDEDGRFELEVPAAAFTLVAAPPDHERLAARVLARPGEERDETFYLEAVPSGFSATVRGDRDRREITRQVIPAEEVAQVAGSQGDTLKAVLNLPGAARPSFGGGALILRGSSPGDSSAFVDGLEIPILYHFGGLRSTFAPRFLDSVEFVPGNFAADYGRLTGGIVNARVRDPMTDALRGEADFNLYDAGVALEGPLSGTWSAGGAFRRSWIDTILPLFIPKDSTLSFSTAPRFYDYQFIAAWKPDASDRVRFLFFGSQDRLALLLDRPANDPAIVGDLRARIAFHELMGSWAHTFSPALRHESFIALGLQTFETRIGPGLFFDLDSRRLDGRSTFVWQAARGIEARAGLDVDLARADVSLDLPQVRKEGEPPTPVSTSPRVSANTSDTLFSPAAFAELRLSPAEGLALVPSVRLDWTSAVQRWSVDPRLAARWRVAPGTLVKAAAGVYQQAPSPDESAAATGTPDLLLERSYQYSAGLEQAVVQGVDLDVTGFYKDLRRLVVRNTAAAIDPAAPRFVNGGTGRIYGVEVLLRARFGERFFGWIAYTFQRSLRTDRPGAAERRFDFDQPHLLTVLGTYRFNAKWALGARFRLVSGNPYTPVTGSIYDAATDVFVPTFGAVNAGRLGTFHALDVRLDRTWTYDRWRLSGYLDIQNVYNRGNQEGWSYSYDFSQRAPATGLPILPILGLKAEW
jgi:TonB family protein